MEILCNTNINRNEWDEFYRTNFYSSPFQSTDYYDFFNSVNGFSAEVYAVKADAEMKALCVVTFHIGKGIKGYFSKRAIIYGGPLLKSEMHEDPSLDMLIQYIDRKLKKKVIYVEIRNLNNYSNCRHLFNKYGWKYLPYLNYQIDCSSYDLIWKKFNSTRRRQIKRSIEAGVQIVEATCINDVDEFYSILEKLYNRKIKKPLPPRIFFENFFKFKLGKYLLVKYNETVISGIMCPYIEGKTLYEFYICGLDHEFKSLNPSVMATYAAIDYAHKHGFKCFDFMGAGKPSNKYGVREFKSKFGGELLENGRFIRIFNPFLYKFGEISLSLLKWVVNRI